jgi:exosortase B
MSTVLEQRGLDGAPERRRRSWLAAGAGLALLFVPTYVELARGLWRDDAYAQGPIVLAVFGWLAWRDRAALAGGIDAPSPVAGAAILLAGLLLYVVGRSQGIGPFELAAELPVIAGAVLLLRGPATLRRLAFPLAFLLFLVPLPGFVLDGMTGPLKSFVSAVVAQVLQLMGYPVTRSGVVLSIGQHQMLVADACSGMNSLYSLFALAILYLHLTGPSSRGRWAGVLASIVPIAIAANVLRVLVLVLVTVHYGEAAGQGFLHGAAGMVVFAAALGLVLAVDRLWQGRASRSVPDDPTVPRRAAHDAHPTRSGSPRRESTRTAMAIAYGAALAMACAAIAAVALRPVPAAGPALDLDRLVPVRFGDWREDPELAQVAPAPEVQASLDRIYRQVVSRTYVNGAGERMMLTVAYGGDQSDALKAHRQEACYSAQGFRIHGLSHGTLDAAGRSIPVTRMLAVRGARSEPVTYWFTMGDRVVLGRAERLAVQLRSGLAGIVPDGMLVRVSSLSRDAATAYAAQQGFVAAILASMPADGVSRLVGAPTVGRAATHAGARS